MVHEPEAGNFETFAERISSQFLQAIGVALFVCPASNSSENFATNALDQDFGQRKCVSNSGDE